MSSQAGEIIYKAFAPNLKIMLCVGLGFIIVKQGLFLSASAKGVSILAINVGLPALIFSSMVTAFTPENISAFGSLAIVAILYQSLGIFMAWLVRELFFVPIDFRWGILVLGISSNWGNLPIAIVQTLGKSSPFNGIADVDLGIAYDAVFVLIMNTTFFPLGVHKLCALDFKEEHLSRPPPLPLKARWANRMSRTRAALRWKSSVVMEQPEKPESRSEEGSLQALRSTPVASPMEERYPEKRESAIESDHGEGGEEPAELKIKKGRYLGGSMKRKTSRASSFTSMLEGTRPIPSTAPLDAPNVGQSCRPNDNSLLPVCSNHGQDIAYHHPVTPAPSVHRPPLGRRLLKFGSNFLMPTTIALVLALPCSLVLPIKALFIDVDGWTGSRIPNAPDDRPPLAFILETASFVGAITVPASLILLGASMARLTKPNKWKDLPYSSIIAMTVGKMILIPVFGIFFVQALRNHTGLYPPEDKMRTFLAILCSGTPGAINQLVVTQLYNPAGSAHTLAMFLAVQYILMPILSTALAGIALYIVT